MKPLSDIITRVSPETCTRYGAVHLAQKVPSLHPRSKSQLNALITLAGQTFGDAPVNTGLRLKGDALASMHLCLLSRRQTLLTETPRPR